MQKRQEIHQKSRLGTLLIHKGLITRQQLDTALTQQAQTGMRLGEVLVVNGWISEKQLNKALKKQSRYRLVAAVSALLVGPMQPFMSNAHAAVDDNLAVAEQTYGERLGVKQADTKQMNAAEMGAQSTGKFSRMQALSDSELGGVSGQSGNITASYDKLLDLMNGELEDGEDLGLTTLETLATTLVPGVNLLDADIEISGVEYDAGPRASLNADGSIDIKTPNRIRQIALNNVRVAGSEGSSFGDITLNNINLEGTSVKIHLRP